MVLLLLGQKLSVPCGVGGGRVACSAGNNPALLSASTTFPPSSPHLSLLTRFIDLETEAQSRNYQRAGGWDPNPEGNRDRAPYPRPAPAPGHTVLWGTWVSDAPNFAGLLKNQVS